MSVLRCNELLHGDAVIQYISQCIAIIEFHMLPGIYIYILYIYINFRWQTYFNTYINMYRRWNSDEQVITVMSLGRHGASNHRQSDFFIRQIITCLLRWRHMNVKESQTTINWTVCWTAYPDWQKNHQMSALLALCVGNPSATGRFLLKWAVIVSMSWSHYE